MISFCKHIRPWIIPAAAGLFLVIACYIYWNSQFTFGSGDEEIERAALIKNVLRHEAVLEDPRVLPVNVSYDQMMVPYADDWGIPAGDIAITDRGKLLRFCDSLAAWNNYRYILIDIDFGNGLSSPYDSALFARIGGMRDIVVASSDPESTPEALASKAAPATYTVLNSGDSFMKYRYLLPGGRESIALRMWKDLTGGTFKKHWWGYSSNGKLCNASVIPPMDYVVESDYSEDGEKLLYQLGTDIIDGIDGSAPLFNDRIILIGDWKENDMHDTIRHEQPGIAILYNAFLALKSGKHHVPFWILLLLFVLFTIELRILFRPRKATVRVRSRSFRVIHFMELLFGYSTPLALMCIVLYLCCGMFVNTLIVGGVFSIIDVIIEQ